MIAAQCTTALYWDAVWPVLQQNVGIWTKTKVSVRQSALDSEIGANGTKLVIEKSFRSPAHRPPPPAASPRALAAAKLNFNYNYTRPEHSAEEFFVSEDNELQLITFLINN